MKNILDISIDQGPIPLMLINRLKYSSEDKDLSLRLVVFFKSWLKIIPLMSVSYTHLRAHETQ